VQRHPHPLAVCPLFATIIWESSTTVIRTVLAAASVLAVFILGTPAAVAAGVVPPSDTSAVGGITLCDQNGQQVTSGSVDSAPVVWRAVDSTAAPKGYGEDGTATLYAFQPRVGVAPGDWSGEQLTASSRYSDPAHPMAAATSIDESLSAFLGDYPLSSLGVVELRMYLGAPDQPPYSILYDASYLQVTGDTWRQLDPGTASCSTSGNSVSLETVALPKKELHPSPTPSHQAGLGGSTPAPSGSSSSSAAAATGGNAPSSSASLADAADRSGGTSHESLSIAIVVVLALLVTTGGGFALRRRSHPRTYPRSSDRGDFRTQPKGP
jgi:hypothetical protein